MPTERPRYEGDCDLRILVLSTTTGYQLRSFGDAAAKLGIELVFATDRCHTLDDPWQDAAVAVRFDDLEGSVAAVLAAQPRVDGVIAVGDRPVVLASRIAQALGLPGSPPEAAAASANKLQTRILLARAGLPTPWHMPASIDDDPRDLAARAQYPAIVKPLSLSGSRGVIRADTPRELVAAFTRVRTLLARPDVRALRLDAGQCVLIEGYVAGREYAVEGLLTRGVFRALAIFDKPDPLDGPFFEETIYVTPPKLSVAEQETIAREVGRAAAALGLQHGAVHAECRLTNDEVFVLEVAARPIGGLCSAVLRFGPEGDSTLEELLLRHARGDDVSTLDRERAAAAVMMIPIPRRGVFKRVDGVEAARSIPYVEDVRVTAKKDQLLEPLPEAGSYLGFIFARAPSPETAETAVRTAHGRLMFAIDPAIGVSAL
jgi:biotin carboxylase